MTEKGSPLETVVGLVVLAAVLTQTWMLIQDATQGDAGRQLSHWWAATGRPAVIRAVSWVDAKSITERMISEEIEPLLKGMGT